MTDQTPRTDAGREAIHIALRVNADRRDALRGAIHAAIREGRSEPSEAAQMRAILADDERLRLAHLRWCREGCGL